MYMKYVYCVYIVASSGAGTAIRDRIVNVHVHHTPV